VHQLKQWQDDLGHSPTVWTKARKVLHFETHPLGRSEPWEQRLDDAKLEWLSRRCSPLLAAARRCSPPGDDEWSIHTREGFPCQQWTYWKHLMSTGFAPAERRAPTVVVAAVACREVRIILMFPVIPMFPLLQRDYGRTFSIFVC
jgi:hypothetical protein